MMNGLGEGVGEEKVKMVGVGSWEKRGGKGGEVGIGMYKVEDVDEMDLRIDGGEEIWDDF